MIKYLKRIGIIISILFVVLQNYCFADSIVISPMYEFNFVLITFVAVLFIVIATFSILKAIAGEENNPIIAIMIISILAGLLGGGFCESIFMGIIVAIIVCISLVIFDKVLINSEKEENFLTQGEKTLNYIIYVVITGINAGLLTAFVVASSYYEATKGLKIGMGLLIGVAIIFVLAVINWYFNNLYQSGSYQDESKEKTKWSIIIIINCIMFGINIGLMFESFIIGCIAGLVLMLTLLYRNKKKIAQFLSIISLIEILLWWTFWIDEELMLCIPLVLIILVFIISVLRLCFMLKREKSFNEINDNEQFENIKKKMKRRVYICGIVFIIFLMLLDLYFEVFTEIKYINIFKLLLIIIFIASIIIRLIKREKISNIFCGIGIGVTIIVIIICGIMKLKSEEFNDKFLQYVQYGYWTSLGKGYEVENGDDFKNLINEIIENNGESSHKISVTYIDDTYTTQEELNTLLNISINEIGVRFSYENYYINEIEFYIPYGMASTFNSQFYQYEGRCLGSVVKSLIDVLISNASINSDIAEKLPTVYFYSSDGTDDYNAVYDEDENDIDDYQTDLRIIRTKITNSHNYEVEMSYNDYGYIGEISITY